MYDATGYGFDVSAQPPKLDWAGLKRKRDAYVHKLNGIYDNNLTKDGIEWFHGKASFIDSHTILLQAAGGDEVTLKTKRVLVATGSHAVFPTLPGASLGIDSDGFFALEHQPKDVVVVGTGYIGIELAGIFNTLGTKVTVVSRTTHILRQFDDTIRENLLKEMQGTGVNFAFNSHVTELTKQGDGRIQVTYEEDGKSKTMQTETVLWAVGRVPNIADLNLNKAGVAVNDKKQIVVDAYQKTSVDHIFALGDVCGLYDLTPGKNLIHRVKLLTNFIDYSGHRRWAQIDGSFVRR
jgi:glutathione reductase (NADPH)